MKAPAPVRSLKIGGTSDRTFGPPEISCRVVLEMDVVLLAFHDTPVNPCDDPLLWTLVSQELLIHLIW